ncbi:MAG TPA: hypothetical protein VMV96_03605 [Acidimicrobiales bacterium]|nr:hypothetical protein [Acidimicrobiales bacterium]
MSDPTTRHRRWPLTPHRGKLPYSQYAGHLRRLCLDAAGTLGVLLLWLAVGHPGPKGLNVGFLFAIWVFWSAYYVIGYALGARIARRKSKVTHHS